MPEGGGRWVGSNKVVELKKKENKNIHPGFSSSVSMLSVFTLIALIQIGLICVRREMRGMVLKQICGDFPDSPVVRAPYSHC